MKITLTRNQPNLGDKISGAESKYARPQNGNSSKLRTANVNRLEIDIARAV